MKADPQTEVRSSTDARRNQVGTAAAAAAATLEAPAKLGSKAAPKIVSSLLGGPSHVLFSALVSPPKTPPNNNNDDDETKKPSRCIIDPRLESDYVYKRKRAHEFIGKSPEWSSSSLSVSMTAPWEGVSGVEQELVGCCELLPDDFYEDSDEDNNNEDEENETDGVSSGISSLSSPSISPDNPVGGVLLVEKECKFAAILSRGCHTMASRSLAIAILERTLEAYREEEATKALLLRKFEQNDEEQRFGDTNKNDDLNTQERVERDKPLTDADTDQQFPNDAINNNNETKENDAAAALTTSSAATFAKEDNQRFRLFFAAGGLRILNQWLADASSYETTTTTPSLASSAPKTAFAKNTIIKAHTTRPIALSILLFLEHIPFDKKTVTNSKINKQVQKLGKKVALIKEAHQNGQAPVRDLENWTIQKPTVALTQTLAAIDAVKSSWREKAKTKGEKKKIQRLQQQLPIPFGPLQSKIRERLRVLNQFQSGALSIRPEWYRPLPIATKKGSLSSPLKRKASNETETEKRILQKKIKQVQSRSQKSLRELREKLRKHNHHTHSATSRSQVSSFKRVSWKDGLKSQVARNRQVLEDVVVFGKDLPSSSVGRENAH